MLLPHAEKKTDNNAHLARSNCSRALGRGVVDAVPTRVPSTIGGGRATRSGCLLDAIPCPRHHHFHTPGTPKYPRKYEPDDDAVRRHTCLERSKPPATPHHHLFADVLSIELRALCGSVVLAWSGNRAYPGFMWQASRELMCRTGRERQISLHQITAASPYNTPRGSASHKAFS